MLSDAFLGKSQLLHSLPRTGPSPPFALTDDQSKFVCLCEGFLGNTNSVRKKYTGKVNSANIEIQWQISQTENDVWFLSPNYWALWTCLPQDVSVDKDCDFSVVSQGRTFTLENILNKWENSLLDQSVRRRLCKKKIRSCQCSWDDPSSIFSCVHSSSISVIVVKYLTNCIRDGKS